MKDKINDSGYKKKVFCSIHALLKAGNFQCVIDCIVNPKNGNLKSEYRWDANHAWYCVGLAEFDRGKFQNAAHAFRRAYRANLQDYQSLFALGDCFDELKGTQSLVSSSRLALNAAPQLLSLSLLACYLPAT